MASSAVERVFNVTELLTHILSFVGVPSDFEIPLPDPNENRNIAISESSQGNELARRITKDFRDLWVRCRSVSKRWKLVIESSPEFWKYSWRQPIPSKPQDEIPVYCFPAFEWLFRCLQILPGVVWGNVDIGILRRRMRSESFPDLYLCEPAVSGFIINFSFVRFDYNNLPFKDPAVKPVTIADEDHELADEFFLITVPTGVKAWNVLGAILDVIEYTVEKDESLSWMNMGFAEVEGEQFVASGVMSVYPETRTLFRQMPGRGTFTFKPFNGPSRY
ncbi:hypothetical protein ABW19_dt0204649 [Dactylella cylindrospora]|nr:hypothetical protein ABW19_dt0204649 [Dactylella cylindrospora]